MSRALINALSFIGTLVLARLLMPADFGLVAIAATIATIVSSVTELSLSSALIQHREPTDAHYDSAFTLNLVRALIVSATVGLLAIPVARFYGDARLTPVMATIALSTAFGGLLSPRLATFSRNLVFWQEFAITVAQKFASVAVSILVALQFPSYWAIVAGAIASQIAPVVTSYLIAPYRPRLSFSAASSLLSFSVWLSLAQLVNTANYRLDQLFVGYFLGSERLGHYNVGSNLAVMPTQEATAPISQLLFPAFTKLADEESRLKAAYLRSQRTLCAIAFPMGVGFAVISEPMVSFALGEKWRPVIIVIQALAAIFALQAITSALQPLALALGETRRLFFRDLLNFAVRLPLVVAGMALLGLAGIVYARCVSGLLSIAFNMALVRRLADISPLEQLLSVHRSLLSVGTMSVIVSLLPDADSASGSSVDTILNLALMIAAGAISYCATHMILWIVEGRPDGIESDTMLIIKKVANR
jgi:PST family polysaccharide transporter